MGLQEEDSPSPTPVLHPIHTHAHLPAAEDEEVSLLARLAGRLAVNSGGQAGAAASGRPGRAAAAAAAKKTANVVDLLRWA